MITRRHICSVVTLIVIAFIYPNSAAFHNATYAASPTTSYLSSPGYPTSYSNNLTFEVTLSANQGEVIYLDVVDCEIEYASAKIPFCQVDELIVYDGQFDNETVLYQGCCLTAVPRLQSTANFLFLRFTSDTTITAKGFRVRFYNNVTVESESLDVSSANLTYVAVALGVVVCCGAVAVAGFLFYKMKAKGKLQRKINPFEKDEANRKYSADNKHEPSEEPDPVSGTSVSPVPKPSPWRPNSGMQLDDSRFGPKNTNPLLLDKALPDGSTKGNTLPPVKEKMEPPKKSTEAGIGT